LSQSQYSIGKKGLTVGTAAVISMIDRRSREGIEEEEEEVVVVVVRHTGGLFPKGSPGGKTSSLSFVWLDNCMAVTRGEYF